MCDIKFGSWRHSPTALRMKMGTGSGSCWCLSPFSAVAAIGQFHPRSVSPPLAYHVFDMKLGLRPEGSEP